MALHYKAAPVDRTKGSDGHIYSTTSMRVSQLRSELLAQVVKQQALLSDPSSEARAFGLSEEEIEYLRKPIKAIRYIAKYRVSKDKLSKAIGLGKLEGCFVVMCFGCRIGISRDTANITNIFA